MNDIPVIVGKITGVSGVKGWVKIFSHTEPRINIIKYNPWLIKQGDSWASLQLITGRSQGKTIVAQLEGINDRDSAMAMIGKEVAIQQSQLKELSADDFYWRDLEGLQVVDIHGETVGTVSHLIETGANDVMVVELPAEIAKQQKIKEIMIPYLKDSVVKTVNLKDKIITVDWDNDFI